MIPPRPARLLLVIMATGAFPCPAQPMTDLELQRHAGSTDLLVRCRGPVHEPLRVRVQRSPNLRSWENIGAVLKGPGSECLTAMPGSGVSAA